MFVADLRIQLAAHVGPGRIGDIYLPAAAAAAAAAGGAGDTLGAATAAAAAGPSAWSLCNVACGAQHTAALTSAGCMWVWGNNDKGQLGVGAEETEEQYEPFLLDCFSLPVKQIACGDNHCLIIILHGAVFAWGDNTYGQLGLGNTRPAYTPQGVSALRNAIDVFAASNYSACITAGIKDTDITAAAAPAAAAGAPAAAPTAAPAGFQDTQQAGQLYMWGSAESGRLGLGEKLLSGAVCTPHAVSISSPVTKVALGKIQIYYVSSFSLFVSSF